MDFLNTIWADLGVRAVVSFLFILGVIVFIHEMGHFLVARWNKVRIEVFSIGFGPEVFGWNDRHGTRWKVGLLPLGGYVRFFGDANAASMPGEDAPTLSEAERAVSFHHKRLFQRAAIVFAGPFANFLLAIVILGVLFSTIGQRITPPDISMVKPGSAAEAAGFQPGDLILSIDGKPISRFEELQQVVRDSAGVPLTMVVRRDGREVPLVVTPRSVERTDRFGNVLRFGLLGVGRTGVVYVRLNPLAAVGAAVAGTYNLTAGTVDAIAQMIAGTRSSDDLGGPIRIAQVAGEVAQDGFITIFWFMAVLSINLGLINLMPVPLLDGGHLLFYAFEAIRGRPLGERAQEYGFRIGIALLFSLMVFATWNDLVHLKVVDFFVGLFS